MYQFSAWAVCENLDFGLEIRQKMDGNFQKIRELTEILIPDPDSSLKTLLKRNWNMTNIF